MRKQKKSKKVNKGGRPKLDIDPELVYDLAKIHCTNEEIASIVGCHRDTLNERFSGIIEKGKHEGRRSLRRYQWGLVEKGNTQMMMWLGKQILSQRDKFPDEEPKQAQMIVNINRAPYTMEEKSL